MIFRLSLLARVLTLTYRFICPIQSYGSSFGNDYNGLSSYYRPYESDKVARVSRWTGSDARYGYDSYGRGSAGSYSPHGYDNYGRGSFGSNSQYGYNRDPRNVYGGGGYNSNAHYGYGGGGYPYQSVYGNGRANTGFYNNGYYNPNNSGYFNRDPYAMSRGGYNMMSYGGSSWKSPLSPDDITSRKTYFDWQA